MSQEQTLYNNHKQVNTPYNEENVGLILCGQLTYFLIGKLRSIIINFPPSAQEHVKIHGHWL